MSGSLDPRPRGILIAAVMLVLLLATLDQTIVSTALPTIVGEFGAVSQLSWVVTAYLLTTTIVGPIYGKLGDLYGRKIVLQTAIGIFILGSGLCGLSRSMVELIAARALQGFGGGGLMVTAMAVIGDIIPPRERGRFQGYFSGIIGVATAIGPLLGGFFVEKLTWRWIFVINLPLGLLAFAVIATAFNVRAERQRRTIDYAGALLMTCLLSCIVLTTTFLGGRFALHSPLILGLGAAILILALSFVFVERLTPEPLLPLALFGNRTFSLCVSIGFGVGLSLFGAVTFLPVYLQIVGGLGPAQAGMHMLALIAGLVVTSIASGRAISRIGRYKGFMVAGTAALALGLLLLSRLTSGTSLAVVGIDMLIVGIGIGMCMPVLVLAVQNSVERGALGTATSAVILFRSVGGAVGVALFGAIFADRLGRALATGFVAGALPEKSDPRSIQALSPARHALYIDAFATALQPIFLLAAAIAGLAFVLTWFLRDVPLRAAAANPGQDRRAAGEPVTGEPVTGK